MILPRYTDPDQPVETNAAAKVQRVASSRSAAIEGYLALLCAGLALVGPFFIKLPIPFAVVWLMVFSLAWLFAISGIRHGLPGACVAAWIAMISLVSYTLMVIVIAWH
jgi:hypothetical protein